MRRFKDVPIGGLSKFLVALAAVLALAVGAWAQALTAETACKHAQVGGFWLAGTTTCYDDGPVETGVANQTACDALVNGDDGVFVSTGGHCFEEGTAELTFAVNCATITTHSWLGGDGTCLQIVTPATIGGLVVPAAGGVPTAVGALTPTNNTNFEITSISWSPGDNPFKYETAYTASIVLTPKAGFTFVGGTYTNASFLTGATGNPTGGIEATPALTLSRAFPATAATPPATANDIVISDEPEPSIFGLSAPVGFGMRNASAMNLTGLSFEMRTIRKDGAIVSNAGGRLFNTELVFGTTGDPSTPVTAMSASSGTTATHVLRVTPTATTPAGLYMIEVRMRANAGQLESSFITLTLPLVITTVTVGEISFDAGQDAGPAVSTFPAQGDAVTVTMTNENTEGVNMANAKVSIVGIERNGEWIGKNDLDDWIARFVLTGTLSSATGMNAVVPGEPITTDPKTFTINTSAAGASVTDKTPVGVYRIQFGLEAASGLYSGNADNPVVTSTAWVVGITVEGVTGKDINLAAVEPEALSMTFGAAPAQGPLVNVTNTNTELDVNARVDVVRVMRGDGDVTHEYNANNLFTVSTGIITGAQLLEANSGTVRTFRVAGRNTTPPGVYNIVFGAKPAGGNQPLDTTYGAVSRRGISTSNFVVFDSITYTVNPARVTDRRIRGITLPAAGGSNVNTSIINETQYRGTISWEPELVNNRFVPFEVYTAIVNLVPATGFTFDGIDLTVPFTTDHGATSVTSIDYAGEGVVRVTFAATSGAAVVTERNIQNIVRPVRTQKPVWRVLNSEQFAVPERVVWDPAIVDDTFDANTVYTVSMTLIAREGFTLVGVPANGFTVTGASSTDFDAATGVLVATFPETDTARVVGSEGNVSLQNEARNIKGFNRDGTKAANFGARPDAGGVAPSVVWGDAFTGTVTWTPEPIDGRFQPGEQYTANMSLTPNVGWTFEGMAANSFRIATTPSTTPALVAVHEAGSGNVQVTFNAIGTPSTVNSFSINGITSAPTTGAIPPVSIVNQTTASSQFDGVVEWTPGLMNGRFVANTVYTARITMEAVPGRTFAGVAATANFALQGVSTTGLIRNYTAGSNVVEFTFPATGSYGVTVGALIDGGLTRRVEGTVSYAVTTVGVPSGFYTAEVTAMSQVSAPITTATFNTHVSPAAQVQIDGTGRGVLTLWSNGNPAMENGTVAVRLNIRGADVDATTTTNFNVVVAPFVDVTGITLPDNLSLFLSSGDLSYINRPLNLTRAAAIAPAGATMKNTDIDWVIVAPAPIPELGDTEGAGYDEWCDNTTPDECDANDVQNAVDAHEKFGRASPRLVVVGDSTFLHTDYVTDGQAIDLTAKIVGGLLAGDYSADLQLEVEPESITTRAGAKATDLLTANTTVTGRIVELPNLSEIFTGGEVSWDAENLFIEDLGRGTVTSASVEGNSLVFSVNNLYVDSDQIKFTIPLKSEDEDELRILSNDDAFVVTVNFVGRPTETTPTLGTINYAAEKLSGFQAERLYQVRVMAAGSSVNEDANFARVTVEADEDGNIDISQWIRQAGAIPAPVAANIQFSLVAGTDPQNHVIWSNSPFTTNVNIPLRPVAPTSIELAEISGEAASLLMTTAMEFRNRLDVDTSWIGVETHMVGGASGRWTIPVGIYQVRNKAVASTSFASRDTVLTFGDVALVEPTPLVTAANIDYANDRLLGLVSGRSYIVASGGSEKTVTAVNNAINIADFMGSSVTIVLVARDDEWENSAPTAAIAIPARPDAPVVTATPVTAAGPGRIEGVKVGMEYKLVAGASWIVVTQSHETAGFVSITAANAGDYEVRYRAVPAGTGAAFASVAATVTVENQTSIQDIAREDPAGGKTEDVAAFVPVRTASKFAAGPSPVVVGGVVNFFGHSGVGSLRIFDAAGKVVREVSVTEGWDLKDSRGRYVAEGTYVVRGVLTVNGERVRVSVPVTVVK